MVTSPVSYQALSDLINRKYATQVAKMQQDMDYAVLKSGGTSVGFPMPTYIGGSGGASVYWTYNQQVQNNFEEQKELDEFAKQIRKLKRSNDYRDVKKLNDILKIATS